MLKGKKRKTRGLDAKGSKVIKGGVNVAYILQLFFNVFFFIFGIIHERWWVLFLSILS